jgi:hypothetical protein
VAEKGDIYHHSALVFHNGEVAKKYIVLLNSPRKHDPCLFVKTTSQQKDKPKKPECIRDRDLFFVPAGATFFKKDTWIQLYEIYRFPPLYIEQCSDISSVGRLGDLIERVIDCLFKVAADDITEEDKKLIRPTMEQSLKKLMEKFGKKH